MTTPRAATISDERAAADGLRARLGEGEPLLGLIVKMPAAATIELAGHIGFDFVLIDGEHGACETGELEHHIRAAEVVGIAPLVRVPGAGSPEVLRALDAGAEGIVVPHVCAAADVARAAAALRYPPEGRRSLAVSTRAGRHGTSTLAEHVESNRERVVLVVQIEDAEALAEVDAILGAPGLDAVFVGPADLSCSLGAPGDLEAPAVRDAVDRIVASVRARPELALCALASDAQDAAAWRSRGARMVLMNTTGLLADHLAAVLARARQPA
ncbi:MAG TPA: aldolase/citrate lyase family protein [Solirubrobacterales bacterium]|nr:aldolase/citrate lyase family protein [Solirubrobacterales bacterium]